MISLSWMGSGKSETVYTDKNRLSSFRGYLYKMKRSLNVLAPVWGKRWFSIEARFLIWYRDQADISPAGMVDLRYFRSITKTDKSGSQHTFLVACQDRNLYLRSSTTAEMNNWIRAIYIQADIARGGSGMSTSGGDYNESGPSRKQIFAGSKKAAGGSLTLDKQLDMTLRKLEELERNIQDTGKRDSTRGVQSAESIGEDAFSYDDSEEKHSGDNGDTLGDMQLFKRSQHASRDITHELQAANITRVDSENSIESISLSAAPGGGAASNRRRGGAGDARGKRREDGFMRGIGFSEDDSAEERAHGGISRKNRTGGKKSSPLQASKRLNSSSSDFSVEYLRTKNRSPSKPERVLGKEICYPQQQQQKQQQQQLGVNVSSSRAPARSPRTRSTQDSAAVTTECLPSIDDDDDFSEIEISPDRIRRPGAHRSDSLPKEGVLSVHNLQMSQQSAPPFSAGSAKSTPARKLNAVDLVDSVRGARPGAAREDDVGNGVRTGRSGWMSAKKSDSNVRESPQSSLNSGDNNDAASSVTASASARRRKNQSHISGFRFRAPSLTGGSAGSDSADDFDFIPDIPHIGSGSSSAAGRHSRGNRRPAEFKQRDSSSWQHARENISSISTGHSENGPVFGRHARSAAKPFTRSPVPQQDSGVDSSPASSPRARSNNKPSSSSSRSSNNNNNNNNNANNNTNSNSSNGIKITSNQQTQGISGMKAIDPVSQRLSKETRQKSLRSAWTDDS